MTESEFFDFTANRTNGEIREFYYETFIGLENAMREMIRKYFSRHLMDTDEEHPLECQIVFEPEGAFGLSSLESGITIESIYQDKSTGDIWLLEEMSGGVERELNDYPISELISIMDGFKEYEK